MSVVDVPERDASHSYALLMRPRRIGRKPFGASLAFCKKNELHPHP
jgi:hypothetical protein